MKKWLAWLGVLLLLAGFWGCATAGGKDFEWGKAPEEGGLNGWPWSGGGPH